MKKENLKIAEKEIVIPISKTHNPKEFFTTKKGLYVYRSFTENIVDKSEEIKKDRDMKVSSFDLVESSTDEHIEESLPKDHLFSESDVCAVVADLISKQPKGEKGILLNNGYANLFYTSSRVVLVRWHGFEWRVIGWFRDDCSWVAGYRVFSPATEA